MPKVTLDFTGFELPEGWTTTMAVFSGPEERFGKGETPFRTNIAISTEQVAEGKDFHEYAEEKTTFLRQQLPDYKVVSDQEVSICGVTGLLREQTFSGPNGMLLQQLVLYFIKENTGYSLAGSHLQGLRFNKIKPKLLELFQSMK